MGLFNRLGAGWSAAMLVAALVTACGGGGNTNPGTSTTETSTGTGGSGGEVTTTSSTTGTGGTGGTGTTSTSSSSSTTGTGGTSAGLHGPPASDSVSAGSVVESPGYRMVFTFGQPTQNQTKTASPGYRMQGGLIGAMGTLP